MSSFVPEDMCTYHGKPGTDSAGVCRPALTTDSCSTGHRPRLPPLPLKLELLPWQPGEACRRPTHLYRRSSGSSSLYRGSTANSRLSSPMSKLAAPTAAEAGSAGPVL